MKKVKITVMKTVCHEDLIEEFENPLEQPCEMTVGEVFIADGWPNLTVSVTARKDSMSPFVMTLAYGGEDIYSGWMKNKKSAMISCNDGFRPVTFLLETLEEEAD